MRYDQKPKTTNKIVLSDVDGTIVKGSLVLNHACFLHDEGLFDLGDTVRDWKRSKKNEARIQALAESYREAIVGHTIEEIGAKDFVNTLCDDPNNFYSTLERLQKHKMIGSQVYLISGSPSFLLTPFARKFGFRSKGTLYHRNDDSRFTGVCTPMYNSESKERYVNSLDLNDKHILALGDTCSDAPLFKVANHSILVAGTRDTKMKLAGMFHEEIHA